MNPPLELSKAPSGAVESPALETIFLEVPEVPRPSRPLALSNATPGAAAPWSFRELTQNPPLPCARLVRPLHGPPPAWEKHSRAPR